MIDFTGYLDKPGIRQSVTFENCIFEDLQYGPVQVDMLGGESATVSTIILATDVHNTVIFRDCLFRDNQALGQVSFQTDFDMCFKDFHQFLTLLSCHDFA